jgi:AcrR family transcriptional regulator
MDIGARSQRERILDAMAESCEKKAFAATTIADIVAHASVSRATFYKHFENKRECFEAAVKFFGEQLEAAVSEAYARGDSAPEALHKAAAATLEVLAANPAGARLLLIEAPSVDPIIIGRYRGLVIGALHGEWGRAKKDGATRPDPRIAFGRAQVLMADYLAAGRAEQFLELRPELVYIALLPFVGQDEALKHAKQDG